MISTVTNHLWQSTVFVVMAGLLTLAFRRNRAQVRYWLWFSASVKFLVPFSLLLTLGGYLGRSRTVTSNLAVPAITYTFEQVAEPFPASPPPALPTRSSTYWIPIVVVGLWACGFAGIALMRLRGWRRIRAAVRSGHAMDIPFPIPVRSTPSLLEPGVVGFFRPLLLLPAGIVERLAPSQLQAVLAHERCHVRRRDNLTAAIHMIVEAVFWFHPLVWWVSARLMEERERACDETVLELGSDPQLYAESILKTCEFCVESPVACVSGVTGADLKKRIVLIMTELIPNRLSFSRKLLLAGISIAAIAGPIVFGLAGGAQTRPQSTRTTAEHLPSFEVAAIKPNRSGDARFLIRYRPGGVIVTGTSIMQLIRLCYNVKGFQVSGGPSWIKSDKYDVEAKESDSTIEELKGLPPEQQSKERMLMMQSLLADRFHLRVTHQTKELSGYALTIAKGGLKFLHAKLVIPDDAPNAEPKGWSCPAGMMCPAWHVSMSGFAKLLSQVRDVGRPVFDKTELQGIYDIEFRWAPLQSQNTVVAGPESVNSVATSSTESAGPSIFTAIQEQLGLKLVSTKGPVDVIVIDHVERPSEN